jgi:hypothetical protein
MSHNTRSKKEPNATLSETSNTDNDSDQAAMASKGTEPDNAEGQDKENQKKNAFQPPSPMTSRRYKSTKSHEKPALTPQRVNQWTRTRDSSSISLQPRSSPIDTSQAISTVSNELLNFKSVHYGGFGVHWAHPYILLFWRIFVHII